MKAESTDDFLAFVSACDEACICIEDAESKKAVNGWGLRTSDPKEALYLLQSNKTVALLVDESNITKSFELFSQYNESRGLIQCVDEKTLAVSLVRVDVEKAKLLIVIREDFYPVANSKYPFSQLAGGMYR